MSGGHDFGGGFRAEAGGEFGYSLQNVGFTTYERRGDRPLAMSLQGGGVDGNTAGCGPAVPGSNPGAPDQAPAGWDGGGVVCPPDVKFVESDSSDAPVPAARAAMESVHGEWKDYLIARLEAEVKRLNAEVSRLRAPIPDEPEKPNPLVRALRYGVPR